MDFRELNYVLAIAKYQNITRAAESLYVSQPTLSSFLISLERELDLKLFRKLGHRYVLTYAGERYVEKARQILRLKNDLDMELADIIKRDVGVLNVAFPPMRCSYMLPHTLPAFQKRYPHVKVNIFEGHSSTNDSRLLEGQVDIAFYSKPNTLHPQIEYRTLAREEMLICTCKNHPLSRYARPNPSSRYPRLDPALLKGERLLQLMPEQRTRQIVDDYIRDKGLTFADTMVTSNMAAIMNLVAVGYGVSFIFETHLQNWAEALPLDRFSFGEPRTCSDFVAAYRKNSYLPVYALEFIDLAQSLFAAPEMPGSPE